MGKKFDPKAALAKQGWSEGTGLGKNNDGIAEPLKASIKHDMKGLGHDAGEQFTTCWWQQVFNKCAQNINIDVAEKETKVSQPATSTSDYRSRKLSAAIPSSKTNLYSSFVKTSTLHGTEEVREVVVEPSKPSSEPNDEFANIQVFTDEMLHAACGGRTAHKGARHGHKMNGKLLRLMQQEVGHSKTKDATPNATVVSVTSDEQSNDNNDKVRVKSKKSKRNRDCNGDHLNGDSMPTTEPVTMETAEEEMREESSSKQQKKKKSKRTTEVDEISEDVALTTEPESAVTADDNINGKTKKRKHTANANEETVAIDNCDAAAEDVTVKKKKSKRKHLQEEELASSGMCDNGIDCDATSTTEVRKKKKKHS